jgi:1,4-alpha-glucan branching enzyme
LVRDLNRVYRDHPALWEADIEPGGFQWIDANNADDNMVAFLRTAPSAGKQMICVSHFSSVIRGGYRLGLPKTGFYREILNTDSSLYGGSNLGNGGGVQAEAVPSHGLPYSAVIALPPLASLWFEVPD